ncbi:MAG TPA: hypothetical protein DCP11_02555 [Microbacteriaceae bacterium]|jgi:uncharacterized membrane protein|nr:hypothetical protein [Microbacteriaceae bacterium]
MTVTLTWLLIITILAAALAIYDGIVRLQGKRGNSILAVAELVFAALMLLSVFVALPAPFTTFLFALILEVVLIALAVLPGKRRRGSSTATFIALLLNSVVVLIAAGWLHIPGLG